MTKYEKETIITFNEEEDTADIYTYNRALQNQIQRISVKYPSLVKNVVAHQDSAKSFIVDKKLVALRVPPKSTDAQQEKRAKLAASARRAKNGGCS